MVSKDKKDKEVIIYTDGACLKNPGHGGYGVLLRHGTAYKELAGAMQPTTNNRMELLAVIKGLEALKENPGQVTIYSDSRYVVNAVEKGWLPKWVMAKFKKKKNGDLWMRFWALAQVHHPKLRWLKGHAGHADNERCDHLATKAAQEGPWERDTGYEESQVQRALL